MKEQLLKKKESRYSMFKEEFGDVFEELYEKRSQPSAERESKN